MDSRRTSSGAILDYDVRVRSFLKQRESYHNHRTSIRKNKCRFFPSAVLRETVEENLTAEAPSSDTNVSQGLVNSELSALDAYFNKLQGKAQVKQDVSTSLSADPKEEASGRKTVAVAEASSIVNGLSREESATRNDLRSVEVYLDKLVQGSNVKQPPNPTDVQESERELENLVKEIIPSLHLPSFQEALVDGDSELESEDPTDSAGSESYVVYVLAAINIAVYLFGLASPVDTAGMGTSTLPLLYGAKVNELILDGEWWRLITPMFLHSGFLHVALSSWALLFFGPQVENVFGPLAFCMIYFLGGLCGNTCSFFFTPAATIGGTGPIFALFSAWVAYLWQNRKVLGEKSADYGIKATTLMGVLVLCLSCLLPTDEWIHLGAILPGALFGAFSCPLLQVAVDANDTLAKNRENVEGREGVYAMYDSPSLLSLTLAFVICTALCFGVLNLYAPMVAESQLLENVPF